MLTRTCTWSHDYTAMLWVLIFFLIEVTALMWHKIVSSWRNNPLPWGVVYKGTCRLLAWHLFICSYHPHVRWLIVSTGCNDLLCAKHWRHTPPPVCTWVTSRPSPAAQLQPAAVCRPGTWGWVNARHPQSGYGQVGYNQMSVVQGTAPTRCAWLVWQSRVYELP